MLTARNLFLLIALGLMLGLELEELTVIADLLEIECDVHRRVHSGWRIKRSLEESMLIFRVAIDRV